MTLADARDGGVFGGVRMTDERILTQGLRWGIVEGSYIKVQKNIKNGPVIISKKHTEMAIGRELAKSVIVEPAEPAKKD